MKSYDFIYFWPTWFRKSTIGEKVAKDLGWRFIEADEFLTVEMKSRIKQGILLTPEQLDSWVMDTVIPNITKIEKGESVVVAGLLAEKKYVEKLTSHSEKIIYVNLEVPYEVLEDRVLNRSHFAKKEMLDQCWEYKEKFVLPGFTVDGTKPINEVAQEIYNLVNQ